MRATLASIALTTFLGGPACGATLVASRPGVMCASPAALAYLTLPDGSSRSARRDPGPKTRAAKRAGGCVDIPAGAAVAVLATRRNTSIITYDARDGRGARRFFIPNVDFSAVPQASSGRKRSPDQVKPAARQDRGVARSTSIGSGSTRVVANSAPHVIAESAPQIVAARPPAWPEAAYPPRAAAIQLLAAVHNQCPEQGWTEHALSHAAGPWDTVTAKLSAAQNADIVREVSAQCTNGLSCVTGIRLGMAVRMGELNDLVLAICAQPAPAGE